MEPGSVFRADSALTWLFLYRLLLTALLLVLFSYPPETPWLGDQASASLARTMLGLQALTILVGGLAMILHWPTKEQQIQIAIFLDIMLYTLLMHVAGGLASGLGLLPAIAVVVGAILLEGRLSLLFASLATLAVIAQQFYSQFHVDTASGTYTQAGLLGLTFFAVALLAHVMTGRLRESERLAARRQVDIADLSTLNDYIIQEMSTGIVAVDGERKLMLLNNAARRLLGAPGARRGDHLFRLAPSLRDWFASELRLGPGMQRDRLLYMGDTEVRPSLNLLGIERTNGALIYLRDNRELERQAQDMKLAALGRLTASIAHNIRNPLSSVLHAAQLLEESEDTDEADRNLLGILRRNALRIDEIVTSVLELSRRQPAERVDLDLNLWLREFDAEYRESHPESAERLTLENPDLGLAVTVDPRHLGQIVRNLCDNAFKHGRQLGEMPRVRLRAAPDPRTGGALLEVIDSGPGIPEANRRQIFEPFYTTSSTGTGLGLYIASELASANALRLEYIGGDFADGRFRLTFGASSTAPRPVPAA